MTDLAVIGDRRGPLAKLSDTARTLAAASLSANTRRAYAGALKRLDTSIGEGVLDDTALAGYLATLFAEGRAPAVAGQVAAAVRLRAKLLGETSPVGPATDRVLAGFRREGRHRGRGQVGGVTWAQADAASALATGDTRTLAGLRDAAIVALASDAMLRVSEIAAIDVADLTHLEDGAGLLRIRSSKTDQEGRGAVAFLGAPTMRRVLLGVIGRFVRTITVRRRLHSARPSGVLALGASRHPVKAPTYAAAIAELKAEGKCPTETRHRQVKYLNNVIEADHGKLKLLIRPVRGFKTLKTAYATIKGFEVMRALRKGQAGMFALQDGIVGEARIVERAFGLGPCALTEVMALLQDRLANTEA